MSVDQLSTDAAPVNRNDAITAAAEDMDWLNELEQQNGPVHLVREKSFSLNAEQRARGRFFLSRLGYTRIVI